MMANFETIEEKYLDFQENHAEYNSSCSGIGSCEFCNKKLYPMRTKYLKAYINLFKSNKNNCPLAGLTWLGMSERSFLPKSPKLIWTCADTARKWILGDFHKSKCNTGKTIINCDCLLADFIRIAYDEHNENSIAPSFGDQIYPIFKKILKFTQTI
jgi:uncharacterized protein YcsI (UPF0317 family)